MLVDIRSSRYLGSVPRPHADAWVVIGQDGGQSIDLGGRTLFVFSDTLLAPMHGAAARPTPAPYVTDFGERGIFLANSASVSDASGLQQATADMRYLTDEWGIPREILVATPEEQAAGVRFWPEHGLLIDGRVWLYYLGIQTVDRTTVWGFRTLGAGLAVLDPDSGDCTRLRRDGDWCLWAVDADDFHMGTRVLAVGNTVLVFGSLRRDQDTSAFVARVAPGQIDDPAAYTYWHPDDAQWYAQLDQAGSLGDCAPDYSVSYNPYLGQALMTYVDGCTKTLMLRSAADLIGPYGQPQKVGRVPFEPTSELVYLAFEHDHWAADGGRRIYLSYCQPHFVPISLVEVCFQ